MIRASSEVTKGWLVWKINAEMEKSDGMFILSKSNCSYKKVTDYILHVLSHPREKL